MKNIFFAIVIVLNLISCHNLSQIKSDKKLEIIVKNIFKNFPAKASFENIRNFDYDELVILEPYSVISK